MGLRFGFVMPFGDAADVAAAAVAAEQAGWQAIFAWEPVWGVDAWVALTAAAERTSHLRVGTMLTPLPRVRPWDLASRAGTLDRLSGGRVQLAVGLGALHEGWTAFETDQGRRTRVELLEEGLAVYDGLMRGQPFAFEGKHHTVRPTDFCVPPPPVQQPRVPVWVVGAYVQGRAAQPSVERAARWDGLVPHFLRADQEQVEPEHRFAPEELATMVQLARAVRDAAGLPWEGYDVVFEGRSHGAGATPQPPSVWAAAGATWWLEGAWDLSDDAPGRVELARRIAAGPPVG